VISRPPSHKWRHCRCTSEASRGSVSSNTARPGRVDACRAAGWSRLALHRDRTRHARTRAPRHRAPRRHDPRWRLRRGSCWFPPWSLRIMSGSRARSVTCCVQTVPCAPSEWARPCVACCCARRTDNGLSGRILGSLPRWIGARSVGLSIAPSIEPGAAGLMFPWRSSGESRPTRCACICAANRLAVQRDPDAADPNGVTPDRIRLEPHGIEPLTRTPIPPLRRAECPLRVCRPNRPGQGPSRGLRGATEARGERAVPVLDRWKGTDERGPAIPERSRAVVRRSRGIEVLGYSPPDELGALFSRSDVVIVPSLVPEAFRPRRRRGFLGWATP